MGKADEDATRPSPAIRPNPSQYASEWKLRNGTPVLIRPIRPEDEPLMIHFHEALSDQTVYFRYFHMINLSQRVSHERLARICFTDFDREIVLVAQTLDAEPLIIGVGRMNRLQTTSNAEFAVVVADSYQHQGLGPELVRRVVDIASREGVEKLVGEILPTNRAMIQVSKKLGFSVRHDIEEDVVRVEMQPARSNAG